MALIPHKAEIESVVALLESEWDTPEALAKAVIKKVFELVQQRDLFVVAVPGADGTSSIFGPHASGPDALRAGRDGVYDTYAVRPMWGATHLQAEPVERAVPCSCGHARGPHEHLKGRGACWALGGSLKAGPTCGCIEFKESA